MLFAVCSDCAVACLSGAGAWGVGALAVEACESEPDRGSGKQLLAAVPPCRDSNDGCGCSGGGAAAAVGPARLGGGAEWVAVLLDGCDDDDDASDADGSVS